VQQIATNETRRGTTDKVVHHAQVKVCYWCTAALDIWQSTVQQIDAVHSGTLKMTCNGSKMTGTAVSDTTARLLQRQLALQLSCINVRQA